MMSAVTYIKHSLVPQKRESQEFFANSIADLDPHWDRPYIAILDGKAVLRKDWGVTIYSGHALIFIDVTAIPQGGGSSDPIRMVAMLAVVVLSVYTGGLAWGAAMGLTGAQVGAIAGGAVLLAGSALVNALIPPPTASVSNTAASMQAASPTYSLQAQGNFARLEQAIPEHFGRHLAYPDFAAAPYQEFFGNDQLLYQVLCIGRGEYDIETTRIEDTSLGVFENVATQVVQPYGALTLVPANVITSAEVAGAEMEVNTYTVAFVANPEGTLTTAIGYDFVTPRGMYYANDDGAMGNVRIGVDMYARQINDVGAPIGDFILLGHQEMNGATTTPQRFSFQYAVSPGRYDCRVMRTTSKNTESRCGNDIQWSGLRAYMPASNTYGDCTLLAVRMQSNSQLNSMSSRKINVIATRKLPVWNGNSWTSPTATRSIAWALAYICKQAGLTDAQIDLAALSALDNTCNARGDYCDGRIDGFLSLWDALTKVASAGRCKPYMQGGVMRFYRDEVATLPVAMFSMMNIVKGSFSVDYLMPTTDTADAIDVGYFDSDVWKQRRVQAALPGSAVTKPTKIETNFITGRQHAYREGIYQAASNKYRRKLIHFQTEMDGFIPSFGDLIAIQHDMPAWGQGGEIIAWNGVDVLTISEPDLTWGTGTHYIALRKPDGSMWGPVAATLGSHPDEIVVASVPNFTVSTGTSKERTHYIFGLGATWGQKARVLAVRPKGLYGVEIEAINEDDSVHTADQGITAPLAQTTQLPQYTASPLITGLTIASSPTSVDEMRISWNPSAWADSYIVEQSEDWNTWSLCGQVSTPNLTTTAMHGPYTIVRVAAVGGARGDWSYIRFPAEAFITPLGNVSGLVSFFRSGATVLSWTAVTDLARVVDYEIRKGAAWGSAQVLGFTPFTEFPADGNGTYWVSAHSDYARSASPAAIIITGSTLTKNVVASWDENGTGWPGDFSGGACIINGSISLGGEDLFSSIALLSEVTPSVAYLGGVTSSGSYTIPESHEVDVGTVQACNCSVDYTARADNPFQLFSIVPLVSALSSVAGNYSGQAGVKIQIATSDGAGVYGDWRDFYPGSYVGRKFKFRANLYSSDTSVIAALDTFSFSIDMDDRIDRGTGVAIASGGSTISYNLPFQVAPSVQVTVSGATAGDDVVLSGESTDGLTVQVFNGGLGVARNINWLAQGY